VPDEVVDGAVQLKQVEKLNLHSSKHADPIGRIFSF
jgi:hypothetical protein